MDYNRVAAKKKTTKKAATAATKVRAEKYYKSAAKSYIGGKNSAAMKSVDKALTLQPTHSKAKVLKERLTECMPVKEGKQPDGTYVSYCANGEIMVKDANGHFVPGHGKWGGRVVGSKNKISLAKLIEAIEDVETEEGVPLLHHFVLRGYQSDPVLLGLMKKVLPDLKSFEGLIAAASYELSEDEAKEIQETLKQRCIDSHILPTELDENEDKDIES